MSDPKYKRDIQPHPATARVVASDLTKEGLGDPRDWLVKQNREQEIHAQFLLAHAEDGVIWGTFDEKGRLITSFEASADAKYDAEYLRGWGRAELRAKTLWQARIFGKKAELFLWRDGDGKFHARVIQDGGALAADEKGVRFQEAFDEPQILWGTDAKALDNDFTLMTDGAQGMRHAVPLKVESVADESVRPLRLVVRHYLADEDLARIAASRLVELKVEVAK